MAADERIRVGDRVTIFPPRTTPDLVVVHDFWHEGRHQRVSLKTSNKKVAVPQAVKLDSQLTDGTYKHVASTATIADATGDYLRHLETEGRARRTIVRYRSELRALSDYCLSHRVTRLAQITPTLFDRFRAERKQNHSAKTLYHEGMVAKQFLKWCASRHLIAQSPLQDYKLQEPPMRRRPAPSLEEVRRILATSTPRQRVLLAVLALTGMRSGELQRLRKEDIDLDCNWIHIVSRPGAETKTRQSRKVPVHPLLRALLEHQPHSSGPWFFTAEPSNKYPDGQHWINTKKLNDRFKATAARLGLPVGRDGEGYTVHSLRHFTETHGVNSGIPQRVIDTWLGHHSDKSMGAVYYKLSDLDSQTFMIKVPFGDGMPAADAGQKG